MGDVLALLAATVPAALHGKIQTYGTHVEVIGLHHVLKETVEFGGNFRIGTAGAVKHLCKLKGILAAGHALHAIS